MKLNGPEPSADETYRFRSQVSVARILEAGDVARWWCLNTSATMPTTVIPSGRPGSVMSPHDAGDLFDVRAESDLGTLTLRDLIAHPESGVRGLVILKGGTSIVEAFPGMRPEQSHFLASCAKPAAALVIEHLIDAGAIEEASPIGDHLPALASTGWAGIPVRDVLDMTHGMDCGETDAAFADPGSVTMRTLLAEFGEPFEGRVERLVDVLASSRSIRPTGQMFEYGSSGSQVLVLLAEALTGQPWAEAFRTCVWSHLGAEGPLLVHLSPEGVALAHGIVSGRLRDLARFGALYTPAWSRVSDRRIVSRETLARIQAGPRDRAAFFNSDDAESYIERLGDDTMLGNARHWDCVWPDGDMFKSGYMGQGLYVSPERNAVIAFFSATPKNRLIRYLRPIMRSGALG